MLLQHSSYKTYKHYNNIGFFKSLNILNPRFMNQRFEVKSYYMTQEMAESHYETKYLQILWKSYMEFIAQWNKDIYICWFI